MKLHCVHVGGWLSWLLIDIGRHCLLWEAPFPRQCILEWCMGLENYMRYESKKQGSNDVFVSSLFLSVDVMRLAA